MLPGRVEGDLPAQQLLPRQWRSFWHYVSPGGRLRIVGLGDEVTLAIAPPRDALADLSAYSITRYRPRLPRSVSSDEAGAA